MKAQVAEWRVLFILLGTLIGSVSSQAGQSEENFVVRHPYVANIRESGLSACTGILTSYNTVLTAAQCVDPRLGNEANPEIWLNITRSDIFSEGAIARKSVETIFHPNYTGNAVDGYNIAFLRLNETVAPLRPIRTLFDGFDFDLVGNNLLVLGFGRTSLSGARSASLHIGTVEVVDSQLCIDADIGFLPDQMFCVDSALPCSGDMGGPLFRGVDVHSEILLGMVSGTGCFEEVDVSGVTNLAHPETIVWINKIKTDDNSISAGSDMFSIEEYESSPEIAEAPDFEFDYSNLDDFS